MKRPDWFVLGMSAFIVLVVAVVLGSFAWPIYLRVHLRLKQRGILQGGLLRHPVGER